MKKTDYLIIGAGLTGCGIALELAKKGNSVILIEQDSLPMNRASLRNEGKIHLGLIYAADPKGLTGKIQLKGALNFYSILQSWLGEEIKKIEVSTPFTYLVANDSLISPRELEFHYQNLEVEYHKLIEQNPNLNYLGIKPKWLARQIPLDQIRNNFNLSRFQAAFATNERAINTNDLAKVVRNAVVSNTKINFIPFAKVINLLDYKSHFKVVAELGGSSKYIEIDAVTIFNATWDQRLILDKLAGLENPKNWLHRLKYRVVTDLPQRYINFPSATMVLGAYGDVVIRQNLAYLSWYPTGMAGWSSDLAPPIEWNRACNNYLTDAQSLEVGRQIIQQTLDWYPSLSLLNSQPFKVDAGAIFAYGESDVDQIKSELHDRSKIGVRRINNFFSVDPGKLTTAPLFAVEAVNAALNT